MKRIALALAALALSGCVALPGAVHIDRADAVPADDLSIHAQFAYERLKSGPTPPAQQLINIGTAPNSGNGDPLRTAFTKDNTNVTALFSMFGTSSNLFSNGSALATDLIALWTSCNSTNNVLGYQGVCVPAGSGGGGISGATNTIACNNTGSTGALSACTPQSSIGVLDSPTANAQTGTSYTPVLADGNGMVTMSNAAANTFCVPPNSSVAYPINTILVVEQVFTGVTSIAPAGTSGCSGTGVQLQSARLGLSSTATYSLGGQYGYAILQQTGTNIWQVNEWITPVGALPGGSMATSGTCTVSSSTLSGTSGTITMGSAGGCTIILTISGAPPAAHGVTGDMGDTNQPTLPTWRNTSSTSNSATFTVPAAVTSGDVLNVGPLGWY